MARHGVDFETVKQAALKLLSKGISPSVQHIRNLLGTGSNSTIAEHLKRWRTEHAAKKVHHLPATIPEALVATFETLWQTAMEHAEQHLTEVKVALESQEEKLNQEKILADKTIVDLKTQLDVLHRKLNEKSEENQTIQTHLAVASERFQYQLDEIHTLKQQHELRLTQANNEKNQLIDGTGKLQTEITQYKNDLMLQAEKHQSALADERALQETSEKRWITLIDSARVETNQWRKKHEEVTRNQQNQIESLQNNLAQWQNNLTTAHVTLEHKNETIGKLNQQLEKIQNQHTDIASELAVLKSKSKLKARVNKNLSKKLVEAV